MDTIKNMSIRWKIIWLVVGTALFTQLTAGVASSFAFKAMNMAGLSEGGEAAGASAGGSLTGILLAAVVSFGVVMALALIPAWFLGKKIAEPLNRLKEQADQVAGGDLEVAVEAGASDEVGALARAFKTLLEGMQKQAEFVDGLSRGDFAVFLSPRSEKDRLSHNLNTLAGNINSLSHEAEQVTKRIRREGDLRARGDAEAFSGGWRELIAGLNAMADAYTDPLEEIGSYLETLSRGDDPGAAGQTYAGGFKAIMDNLGKVREALDHMILEIRRVAQRAAGGDLQVRGSVGTLQNGFAEVITGYNKTLEAVVGPLREAMAVLQDLSEGRLSSRVRGDYKGDHGAIKEALNTMGEALEGYIGEISTILDEMASNNLDVSIEKTYKGDFAKIKASLNHIIEQFNLVMGEIGTAAHQVEAASGQVAGASQSLSQGAAEQAGSVQEISASMTQVGEQTRQNAANANKANEISHKARQAAEEGSRRMDEMLSAMEAINDASGNIAKIIKVIDEIAFQTNILALNAAVEAARAGEHGKGFAVVAEEVRNLAARSAAAARETTDMIDDSLVKVRRGTDLARDTSEALDRIVEGVGEAVEIVGEIAGASNEQATAIAEIGEGILQVSHVTQTNTATAEESASASEEMTSQAKALAELAARFRLRDGGGVRSLPAPSVSAGAFRIKALPPEPAVLGIGLDAGDFGKY